MGTNIYIKSDMVYSMLSRMSHSDYVTEILTPFPYDDHIFLMLVGSETFTKKLPEDVFPIKHIPLNISIWYEINNSTYVVCDKNNVLIPFTTFREMVEFLECLV